MLYAFLVLVGIVSLGVYFTFVFRQVPGMKEERLGVLEPLPPDLGQWKRDTESEAALAAQKRGRYREVRTLHEPEAGLFRGETLVFQARYRDRETNEIVEVEPEVRTRRKRVKGSA